MLAAAPNLAENALDTAGIANQITELCGYISAATYRLLVLIREFDEAGGWHGWGLCSCAHWLNLKCGIGMNAAREKVRVAHALATLPKISAAFECGELSYSKVRAMTRIADEENEDYLLQIARHGTAYHTEKLVQLVRRTRRLLDAELAEVAYQGRYLNHHYDADGCLVIKARLPAEQGALVVKALERSLDRSMKPCRSGFSRDQQSGLKALPQAPSPADEPIEARRADALVDMAEAALANDNTTASGGDRYQVVVHVSAETSANDTGTAAHLEDGPRVSAETSRRLGCDCSVIPVLEDGSGEPLSIGRKSRSIPPAIRRALRLRDRGCRFPGCTNHRFTDGHHVKHWADGGETALDNLVTLCRHHHRLVHEGGFGCERDSSGEFVFTAPERTRLCDDLPMPPVEEDAYAWFARELAEHDIGPDTCISEFNDPRIDWNLAVAPLVPSQFA